VRAAETYAVAEGEMVGEGGDGDGGGELEGGGSGFVQRGGATADQVPPFKQHEQPVGNVAVLRLHPVRVPPTPTF